VDAEFQKALLVVFAVGGFVAVAGATLLLFAFRAHASEEKRKVPMAIVLTAGLLAFVFLACFLFLMLAMREAQ
jgi:uncharacterized membrane protein HdeD (DUF308 family)